VSDSTNNGKTTPPAPAVGNAFVQQLGYFIAIIGMLLAVLWIGVYAVQYYEIKPADNAVLGFLAITAIIMAFAGAILWKIVNGDIPLVGIISEPRFDADGNSSKTPGKASLARFQFLLFTFVVAGLFLMLSIEVGQFVNIPANVLGLMGISGGSFVLSKAIGQQSAPPVQPSNPDETDTPVSAPKK